MQITSGINHAREVLGTERAKGRSIGFVPTMGYFHHGHMSLMKKAKEQNDVVVVSIFVNPTQFSQGEDLGSYPRDMERDAEIAEQIGVDFLFAPEPSDIYPPGYQTHVEVGELSQGLCGRARPGHFRGVATVVLKLFNIVEPDKAYFGLKDYQQYRVIERMVGDLNLKVELECLPTVRDDDGLAASSRNSYLTYDEREQAQVLYQSLIKAKEHFEKGTTKAADIVAMMGEIIDKRPLVQLEYIQIMDKLTLKTVETVEKDKTLIALAAKAGKARLIDNIEL